MNNTNMCIFAWIWKCVICTFAHGEHGASGKHRTEALAFLQTNTMRTNPWQSHFHSRKISTSAEPLHIDWNWSQHRNRNRRQRKGNQVFSSWSMLNDTSCVFVYIGSVSRLELSSTVTNSLFLYFFVVDVCFSFLFDCWHLSLISILFFFIASIIHWILFWMAMCTLIHKHKFKQPNGILSVSAADGRVNLIRFHTGWLAMLCLVSQISIAFANFFFIVYSFACWHWIERLMQSGKRSVDTSMATKILLSNPTQTMRSNAMQCCDLHGTLNNCSRIVWHPLIHSIF